MNTWKKWFWEQHSNPWSVGIRFLAFFFLVPAVWYHNLYVVAGIIFILIINPVLFSKPKRIDNWLSKAARGEEMWLAEDALNIVQSMMSFVAFVILLVAAFNNLAALTIIFFVGIFGWRILFLYRMVHNYEEYTDEAKESSMGVKTLGEQYRCTVCGNEVTVTKVGGGELVCCDKPMAKLE